ncbi:hypothetical protein [Williamsia herbipolensis]|uniref:hypothetical protein n=1 Tax=Williamsia herbipolensis TaxID=1603258 RepID=UPI0005F7A713|nr:hypothetical protein [Williamsia herbipolensis]
MTVPYDYEALWLKAKMFLNRAMDPDDTTRSFDERALMATFALELLAKSALSRTSPVLIAEPTEDGSNLLVATGLLSGEAQFITVRAKTIYSRCQKAFRPFNADEAGQFTAARNSYIHSGTAQFTNIPEDGWWPKFWRLALILNTATDHDLEELVGDDRLTTVNTHLERNKKRIEHQAEMLLENAKTRLAQHRAGVLPARVAKQWAPGRDRTAGLQYQDACTCPACEGRGVVEGDDVNESRVDTYQVSKYDYESVVELTVFPDYFSCWDCGLVLDSFELLEQVGLEEPFTTEGELDDLREPDYGND